MPLIGRMNEYKNLHYLFDVSMSEIMDVSMSEIMVWINWLLQSINKEEKKRIIKSIMLCYKIKFYN